MSNQTLKILVIEDNDDIRELLTEALKTEGFSVKSAIHGRDALDMLQKLDERFDVILTDLTMPVMDGWQFLKARHSLPEIASIPVILMTAEAVINPPINVHSVIYKPINMRALRRQIINAVSC